MITYNVSVCAETGRVYGTATAVNADGHVIATLRLRDRHEGARVLGVSRQDRVVLVEGQRVETIEQWEAA